MKNLLLTPQVIGALITSSVAIILALVTTSNNAPPPIPTPTVAPTIITVIATEQSNAEPTIAPTENEPETDEPTTEPTKLPTNEPTTTEPPTAIPTNEPPATNTFTPMPSDTPIPPTDPPPPNVMLIYDDASFTVHNQSSQTVSLSDMLFRSTSGSWEGRKWGPSLASNFPANNCLRLRDINSGQRQPPSRCGTLLGLQLIDTSLLFWLEVDQFEVLNKGNLIATCLTAEDTCPIFVE